MKVGGVILPETLLVEHEQLVLNGAGIRTKFFINVYACGLYLLKKNSNAESIIVADEPMAIRMHIIFDHITNTQMKDAIKDGLKIASKGDISYIKGIMDLIDESYKDAIHKDDIFDLIYSSAIGGLGVAKNGELKGSTPGLQVKNTVFSIWLGSNPLQKALKKALLGL
ncbi:MAG: chalcone isomerase family protein [Desulfobacterales bacterium]|nr:chalcone isomerase family protein [Desulfobacterales bacterium]MBF0398318.1 chalcone isomerase family protein [Desulfobacterales bacterium]